MKRFLHGGAYLLLFLLMTLIVPHLFKQMPFLLLPVLLILAVLVIRQDMLEQIHS